MGEGHQVSQADLAGREGCEPAASGAPVPCEDGEVAAREQRWRTCEAVPVDRPVVRNSSLSVGRSVVTALQGDPWLQSQIWTNLTNETVAVPYEKDQWLEQPH